MNKIRILIVDDSPTIRSALKIMIRRQPDMEVVATAGDGAEGLRLVQEVAPDIVLMDIEMPVMTGIEAVREIMKKCPTPVLIFSSIAEEAAPATLEALEAGAVDFVTKGGVASSIDIGDMRETLLGKIRGIIGEQGGKARNPANTLMQNRELFKTHLLALKKEATPDSPGAQRLTHQISGIEHDVMVVLPADETRAIPTADPALFYRQPPLGFKERAGKFLRNAPKEAFQIAAIGCSTGGPQALHTVLSRIPANFPLPVVVVQHMPNAFIPTFAQRLGRDTEIRVNVAAHGEEVCSNTAYIAPGGVHLRIRMRNRRPVFDIDERDVPEILHKPSVDVMFDSLHQAFGGGVLAAVLTGMGRDGASGAKHLHSDGATVIAQNEATCVVYGMPRAVVAENAADLVLPVEEIGDALVYLAWEAGRRFHEQEPS